MAKRTKPSIEKLIRGYLGFCEGRGKASLTISSYESDLLHFKDWLKARKLNFYSLQQKHFDLYLADLRKEGRRVNTQRRKLLSARALCRFAFTRKKIPAAIVVKAPERKEKLPWIPSREHLDQAVDHFSGALGLRNRLLVRLLAETGMSLSEMCALEWRNWDGDRLMIQGKRKRSLTISTEVQELLAGWRKAYGGKHLFPGFNRFGPTSLRMTNRGVELLFRDLARAKGLPHLHPKSLRHHAVMSWLKAGVAEKEIRLRLGVNPLWSLEPYRRAMEVQ